jgi:NAD(P)H dehydrogenase (quinone)
LEDKIDAGFTNSAAIDGDKSNTITNMITLARQHGMIWIGGLLPANQKNSGRNDLNWMGGFAGVLALSPADASSDETPPRGALETGRRFGMRVAQYAVRRRG